MRKVVEVFNFTALTCTYHQIKSSVKNSMFYGSNLYCIYVEVSTLKGIVIGIWIVVTE